MRPHTAICRVTESLRRTSCRGEGWSSGGVSRLIPRVTAGRAGRQPADRLRPASPATERVALPLVLVALRWSLVEPFQCGHACRWSPPGAALRSRSVPLGGVVAEAGSARRERSQQPSWKDEPDKVEPAERATLAGERERRE
jgi:hypothetical protein